MFHRYTILHIYHPGVSLSLMVKLCCLFRAEYQTPSGPMEGRIRILHCGGTRACSVNVLFLSKFVFLNLCCRRLRELSASQGTLWLQQKDGLPNRVSITIYGLKRRDSVPHSRIPINVFHRGKMPGMHPYQATLAYSHTPRETRNGKEPQVPSSDLPRVIAPKLASSIPRPAVKHTTPQKH